MKVAIIGAGACGLMLATLFEREGIEYKIFNDGKIGNKILASGNGKCNISNYMYARDKYHNNRLADIIVGTNQKKLSEYFKELKIYTKQDNEGRMYPISESSLSVLNILLNNINENIIDKKINSISKKNDRYYLDDLGSFDKVVIAVGSNASYKNDFYFIDICDLNLQFNDFKPSLVGFKTNIKLNPISGVRAKCRVSLINKNKLIHQEMGEVIFKDNGLSGICVMNLSSYYNHLIDNKDSSITIDLIPDNEFDDYQSILHPKLLKYITDNKIDVHKFTIPITSTYDMDVAQVASGGIAIEEINDNLSLKKDKNIYVGGEIIDIDGVCGGYNLMLAFCSSLVICEDVKNEISNK